MVQTLHAGDEAIDVQVVHQIRRYQTWLLHVQQHPIPGPRRNSERDAQHADTLPAVLEFLPQRLPLDSHFCGTEV